MRLSGLCRFVLLAGLVVASAGSVAAQEPRDQPFDAWLEDLRTEAQEQGIKPETLDAALEGVAPIPRIIELDRSQPEFTQTFSEYLEKRVTDARVERGRTMIAEHWDDLSAVGKEYGVQPRFIAAIWGMETNYGSFTGSYPVVASLATLAYDTRRSAFFRRELLNALEILDEGHTTPENMDGSWAGAMGQSQFMPSSFNAYAQDFDGDGRRDIWGTPVDVFASIANYLRVHGWADDHGWGREVRLPEDFDEIRANIEPDMPPATCKRALNDHSMRLPLSNWQALGVRDENGEDLPSRPGLLASLVVMQDGAGPAYLTYPNYRAILSYNCSNFYALAVGTLADELQPATQAQ